MMNKNTGHFLAFSPAWFNSHQSKFLFLLNNSLTKRWFRWVLRIRKCDCPLKEKITAIAPNYFSYGDRYFKKKGKWYMERKTDYRTHPKFAKRIYFAFKPVWWFLHYLDLIWLDRFMPELGFGFDTLTAYPAAGANSPVDGYVEHYQANATWSQIRDGAGGYAYPDTDLQVYILMGSASGTFSDMQRSIFLFDTSALSASATITAVVLSLFGNGKADAGTAIAPNIDIYTSTPANDNNLVAGDYTQIGITSQTGSPITYANWSITAYNDFTFNATGRGNVSKTGISKFGARNANYDVANSAPTWSNSSSHYLTSWSADKAGTDNDPKLVVTYTVPAAGPANLKTYNTNAKANIKSINTNLIANVKTLNTNA